MRKLLIMFVTFTLLNSFNSPANAVEATKAENAKKIVDVFSIGENQTKVLENALLADSLNSFQSYSADVSESGKELEACVSDYYNLTLSEVIRSSLDKNKFRDTLEKMYIDGFSAALGKEELSKLAQFFSNEKVAQALKAGAEPNDLDEETQKLSEEIEQSGIADKFFNKLAEIQVSGKDNAELKTVSIQVVNDMNINKEEVAKSCPNLSKVEN